MGLEKWACLEFLIAIIFKKLQMAVLSQENTIYMHSIFRKENIYTYNICRSGFMHKYAHPWAMYQL